MLGEIIRNLRKENNISQEELAEKLGVSRQSISLWETGQTMPAMENIVTIANIFDVSTDMLLRGNSENSPEKDKTVKSKKLSVWEIVLLVLGSPVWLSLLIAAFAVSLSLYFSFWAIVISLWAVFASLVATAVVAVLYGFVFISKGLSSVAIIGAGIALLGIAMFTFFGCKAATNGVVLLTKWMVAIVKRKVFKKEAA